MYDIACLSCSRLLAAWDAALDQHQPRPEELVVQGRVAVPNLGWFCGQSCAETFEDLKSVTFRRDQNGLIRCS